MSTVVLQTLEWDGCFSFGKKNRVELNKEAVTQIIAPNGFGKSSIPLILEEVLYNKNSKGVKKAEIPNRHLDGNYSITHVFSVDADLYEVQVVRKSGAVKVKLSKNGEDISSHTATNTFKQIEELLGPDFKTFQQLVYQSMNSALAFLEATDSNRKKFLIDLFDLEEYTNLFETFKEAAKSLGSEVTSLESRIETINKWLQSNSSLNLELKEVQELPERLDFSTEVGDLNSKLANIKSHNDAIKKNNLVKKQLESIDIEELRDSNLTKESYDEYQGEIGQLKAAKTSADTVVNKLRGLKDKCPTCLQDIDKDFYDGLLNTHTTDSNEYTARIKELEARVETIKRNNRLFDSVQEQLREWEGLNKMYNPSLGSDILSASDIEDQLTGIRNTLAKVDAEISKATSANNEAMKHNSKIQVYVEQNEKFSGELLDARSQLEILVEKYKNLEVLKKAFSTNGLIAYKLENLVKDLEVYTNEYLAELSDGRFTIEFSISSDRLNVIITDDGKEISMGSASSGEKARINISTLLAIRRLMASISKNTINVLFLDEIVSVLDEYGRERLVEVLLKEEGLNTFLVSHGWSHPLVADIRIKKKDGVSWIENG
jgi:DNA repair exonuclease SbcCD ATPase subunit